MAALTLDSGSFWKKFAPIFAAGTVGALSLAPTIAAQVGMLPNTGVPASLLVAAGLAQSTVVVGVATAVGVALAPKLGLRSLLAEKAAEGAPILPALRRQAPAAIVSGVLGFVAIIASDLLFKPLMPPVKESAATLVETLSHTTVGSVMAALLYGGITEEILLRWGMMTLFAWIGWKLFQRNNGAPRAAIMWGAIITAAVLFGIGHLPAASMVFGLMPVVIVRTILANAVFGLFAGWLYWRHSLEAAMLAHMTAHVALTATTLIIQAM